MTRTQLIVERNKRRAELRSKATCALVCTGLFILGAIPIGIKTSEIKAENKAETTETDSIQEEYSHMVETSSDYLVETSVMEVEADTRERLTESIQTDKGTFYPLYVKCIDINESTDETFCVDAEGNLWSFICDDSNIGDAYSLVMDSKGTELDVADDEIVVVRYER